jgi:hypothetical protein
MCYYMSAPEWRSEERDEGGDVDRAAWPASVDIFMFTRVAVDANMPNRMVLPTDIATNRADWI